MKIVWDDRDPLDLVSLVEAKAHLRVDHSSEDDYIERLIDAAIKMVEVEANCVVFTRGGVGYLNDWPQATRNNPRAALVIPAMPLASVQELRILASDGESYTLVDDATYGVDTFATPGYLFLKPGYSWPTLTAGVEFPNRVQVTFTAGLGAGGGTSNESAVQAVLALVAHWFENREAVVVGTIATSLPLGFDRLVATFSNPLVGPVENLPVGGA